VNGDERTDISDPVTLLGHLFLGDGSGIGCEKSADIDDSGQVNITDAIVHLQHLFLGGPPPSEPAGQCGFDPTPDDLTCETFKACE
jgi:hypothetical protein